MNIAARGEEKNKKMMPIRDSIFPVFFSFLLVRSLSALWNQIHDCDETYNYWEPGHFLLYGDGAAFQTWEYSPRYAIRSYAYLWLYLWPGKLLSLLGVSKMIIFYAIRFYMALVVTCTETFLVSSLRKTFGPKIATYYWMISCLAAGMFASTTAFLPSSFAIYTVTAGFGFWFRRQYRRFIFTVALSAIVGWPFTALIGLPMALYMLFSPATRLRFLVWSPVAAILIGIPTMAIDSYYFGRPVIASLNIILYNVFSPHGPNLYGTEPWSYYVINLFLNFNLAFLFVSVASIFIWAIIFYRENHKQLSDRFFQNQFFVLASLHLWWLVFFLQPHKEERFMYPIYPLISMAAAFTMANLEHLITGLRNVWRIGFILFAAISISRTIALYKGYHSSISIYHRLWTMEEFQNQTNPTTVICLGKEWHRFPSHFLVPPGFRTEFVVSDFRGQLPRHFDHQGDHPTRVIPANMNDQNQEETSRYVDAKTGCHYLIDTDHPEPPGPDSRDYAYARDQANWKRLHCEPFLDAAASSRLFRAFYLPCFYENRCRFMDYCLLKNLST